MKGCGYVGRGGGEDRCVGCGEGRGRERGSGQVRRSGRRGKCDSCGGRGGRGRITSIGEASEENKCVSGI